jgi:hypothetical protein
MLTSSQDILTLCTQEGEIVSIPAQDIRLILDPRCSVLLKEYSALGDHSVCQVNGCSVEQHNVNSIRPQGNGELMGKGSLHSPPVD